MTNPTPLSPASLWHNSTTGRISFNEDSSEIIRIDQQGFHYKGQFIKDAGEAYRLLVEFLRKHQPDQQWGAEHNGTPLSPAAQAVVAAIEKFDWEAGHFSREDIWMNSREVTAAALRAAADQAIPLTKTPWGTTLIPVLTSQESRDRLLAIAAELEDAQ